MDFTTYVRLCAVYATYILVPYLLLLIIFRLTLHPLSKYPGPLLARLTDCYGGYYAIRRCLHLKTYENHGKYGTVVRQGPNRLVFSTATALQEIYQNPTVNKSHLYLLSRMTPRANVFDTLDVILHRRKRKIISQAIAERSMRTFEPIMTEQVDIFVKQLLIASRTPEPLDMTHQCQNLAGDIVGHLSFGYPLHLQTEDTNRWLLSGLSLVSARVNIYMQLPAFYVMEPALKLLGRRIRQKYLQITELMIRSRLAQEKNAKHDLYSFAIDSMGGGNSLKDSELWAEAFFFIVAGGSTTTTAMSALFFYLSRNPTVYDKLASEIRSTFQSGGEIQSGSQLQKCVYLRACINEVLRMATPNTATLWREQSKEETPETLKPLVIDGCVIPRGTQVGVNLYSLHHNEVYFPDPFSFRPERWLSSPGDDPDNQSILLHKAFAPFSVGTRSCPGKAVAFLEITLTLAKTLWYFDFKTAPGALGQQGAGVHGKKGGRGRQNEYQLYDTFTASHSGPFLVFQKREGFGEELET